jgi:hypothetical protein
MTLQRWLWTFAFFSVLGSILMVVGIAAFVGFFEGGNPLLADPMAGWGLIASAVACYLTGGFPLVLHLLAAREGA